MKTRIDAKNRKEAEDIRRGLAKPEVRAFVICCGILNALPSHRARARVLNFVAYDFDEVARAGLEPVTTGSAHRFDTRTPTTGRRAPKIPLKRRARRAWLARWSRSTRPAASASWSPRTTAC